MAWIIVFLLVLGILYVGARYGAVEITRIPQLAVPYTPNDFGWAFEEVSFLSHDGLNLRGWFLPAPQASESTILVLHGLGSNGGDMIPNIRGLYERGLWNLFLYDFRGHGTSEGTMTSLGPLELADFRVATRFVREKWPAHSRRLAVYGHSLGGAIAIMGAAENRELEVVAAESPFARITDTMERFTRLFHGIPTFPFLWLGMIWAEKRVKAPIRSFAPVNVIGQISPRPLFIIQGSRDRRMPESDYDALWKAAKEPKESWIVPGADHGDPPIIARAEFDRRLVAFFEKYFN